MRPRPAARPEVLLASDGSPHGPRRDRRAWVVDCVVFVLAGLASLATLVLTANPLEGGGFRRPLDGKHLPGGHAQQQALVEIHGLLAVLEALVKTALQGQAVEVMHHGAGGLRLRVW